MFKPEDEYYIWAAGTYGRALINLLRHNAPEVKVIAFIDSDPCKQGTIFCGLPVISWNEAKLSLPRIKIIIALSMPTQVRDFLLNGGYHDNDDFYTDCQFIPRYFWETQKKLVSHSIVIHTNNNCVCNCNGCYAYVPFVKKSFSSSYEALVNSFELLFRHLDKSLRLGFNGGETLLNKNIADVCLYLQEHWSHKYDMLYLVTSGILIPSDEEMKKFALAKVELGISDYSETDERAAKNMPLLMQKCQDFGVPFYKNRQSDKSVWVDVGNPYEINITDPEELKARFNKCIKPVAGLCEGKLLACFYQHWCTLATGISVPQGDDSFDLEGEVTELSREELARFICHEPTLGYHTGCAHCGGTFTPYSEG